jgi:predicted dehydrogenase
VHHDHQCLHAEGDTFVPCQVLVAKSIIDDGKLGKVLTARAKLCESTYSQWSEDYVPGAWRTDMKRAGGGYIFDSGSHWVRPLRVWCGDADSVVATVGKMDDGLCVPCVGAGASC